MALGMHKLGAVAALAATLALGAQAPAARIEYTLSPVLEAGALRAVEIDLRFTGEADGETVLELPGGWGGQEELWRSVEALEVVAGARLKAGDRADVRVLDHAPSARVHVRYRIVQDWEGAPRAELGNVYRATIQPAYFHLIGNAALAYPALDPQTPVRFRVARMPRGWSFASDLEHAGLTLDGVPSSVSVGGDFRVLRGGDNNVRVAIRGDWSFSDEAITQQVSEIIASQRRFWSDASSPYLVTVIQLSAPDAGWTSIGGTGLDDAFAFFATPNADMARITRTLAHESLHTWIPRQIGGMPLQGEAAHYWLSEGFTDFMTARLLVRQGVWGPAEFADDLNTMLAAYGQSSVIGEPNARILADFWSDREVQQLPYQRGRLLAMIWDGRLRTSARSLDAVLQQMRLRVRHGEAMRAADLFPLAAQPMGLDPDADIEAHVVRGEPIRLPQDLLAPCGRVETREVPRFHRGYDIEATTANNNVIAGVDPLLPAYAAGMRNGMVLVRRDAGVIGDAEQEIAYVVRDGENERIIRYMPRGHGVFSEQRLVLNTPLEGEQLRRCVAVLGG